jgi:tetratricopeptide (TPR) repeat protein
MRVPKKRSINWIFFTALQVCLCSCSFDVNEEHWRAADGFVKQGQFLRAIEEYTRIVNYEQRGPMGVRAQEEIAKIYSVRLKDYPRAIRAFRDVYHRSDENETKMRARWEIAKLYGDKMGNFSAAAEEYGILYRENLWSPQDGPQILLEWGRALMDAGQFLEAAERFKEYRNSYPGSADGPRAFLEEAQAYLNSEKFELAIKSFREAIQQFSGRKGYEGLVSEAYYGLGLCLEAKDDLSGALTAFKAGLTTYPNPRVIELKIDRLEKRKKERKL